MKIKIYTKTFETKNDDGDDEDDDAYQNNGFSLGKYRRYKNWEWVAFSFSGNLPLSAVQLMAGELYVVTADQVLFQLLHLKNEVLMSQ